MECACRAVDALSLLPGSSWSPSDHLLEWVSCCETQFLVSGWSYRPNGPSPFWLDGCPRDKSPNWDLRFVQCDPTVFFSASFNASRKLIETVLRHFHHACYFGQDNRLVTLSLSCDGQTDFFFHLRMFFWDQKYRNHKYTRAVDMMFEIGVKSILCEMFGVCFSSHQ